MKSFATFLDCLELHKLTVFTHDAAERQKYYIQQQVHPTRATVHQFISHAEVLNEYITILPMLKNSPKAVATTKKEKIPFYCADLASILLAAVPSGGRTSTISCTPLYQSLLADLENIECVMMERNSELKGEGCYSPS